MKIYDKFCSYNICSSFSAESNYAQHTLQYMPNKHLQLPIVHVWSFQWRKFEAQYLDIFMSA